jgi:hypothetical protein
MIADDFFDWLYVAECDGRADGETVVQEFGAEYKVVNSPDDYYAIVVVEFQDGSRVETNYKGEFDRA